MIDVRADSIIYQSQLYYSNLLNDLVLKKRIGKQLLDKWDKADLILGYLEALNYRHLLTDEQDILNVNYILECLIKLCELNQYPVTSPLEFQEAPDVIVGKKGDKGNKGDQGDRGLTGLATDFSIVSVSVSTVVDSFPITDAKAARWDYHVINTANAQRASSIIGHWSADGTLTDLSDSGADDLVGNTSGIEFNIIFLTNTIQLVAVITSGTWSITGSRYFIPNNGNGSGPITNILPLGRIYIGDVNNKAKDYALSGDIALSPTGLTSINPNVIVDADINANANINTTKLASLTADQVVITNNLGKLTTSTISNATLIQKLDHIDVNTSITTLINEKLTNPLTTIGDLLTHNGTQPVRLPIGTNNQVLTVVGQSAAWQNVPAGISGLIEGLVPVASSATTLRNSPIRVVPDFVIIDRRTICTGAVSIFGNLQVDETGSFSKGVKLGADTFNPTLKCKLISGTFDLSIDPNIIKIYSLLHGIDDYKKIVSYDGFVYDNAKVFKNKLGTHRIIGNNTVREIFFLDYEGSVQGIDSVYIRVAAAPNTPYRVAEYYSNATIEVLVWYTV